MPDSVIVVENLSKKYVIRHQQETVQNYVALRDVIADGVRSVGRRLRRSRPSEAANLSREAFWALQDVSFSVQSGEAIGIVGRNGAGKSTLLKILSRITEPTAGRVTLRGRVASLLEVGTGFHAELTGRENIYLNGAIMGMGRAEIKKKFEEIVAFAEVEKFLDTPVKRYSSGMYVRLAFAVAAHLEPEILVVDEVLAVGDVAFQKKCLGKMQDVAQQMGRTVLFVSHNMVAVRSLCHRAILLECGKKVLEGPASRVVDCYLGGYSSLLSEADWPDLHSAPGSENVRLRAVRLLQEDGSPADQVFLDDPLTIEVEYEVLTPDSVINLSLKLWDKDDVCALVSPSVTDKAWFLKPHPIGRYRSRCHVPGQFLNEGRYSVTVTLVENGAQVAGEVSHVVSVEMVDSGTMRHSYYGEWAGAVRPTFAWNTERLDAGP